MHRKKQRHLAENLTLGPALLLCAGLVGCSSSADGGGGGTGALAGQAGAGATGGFGAFGGFGGGGLGSGGLATGGSSGASGAGIGGVGATGGSAGTGAVGTGGTGAGGSGGTSGASGAGGAAGSAGSGGTSGAAGSGGVAGSGGSSGASGGGGTGGTNPAIKELTDPNRPSLSYECAGTPLSASDIVKLFNPGLGWLPIGLGNVLTTVQVSRSCAPLTGCSAWTTKSTSSKSLAHTFYFSSSASSSLMATAYDSYWAKFDGDDVVSVSSGEVFFVNDKYQRPKRASLTRLPNGDVCVSVATTVNVGGSKQDFIVGKGILPPPPVGSAIGASPNLPQAGKCAPGEPSTAKIASTWLAPGSSSLNLVSEPSYCDGSHRFCHPVTGCSAWLKTSCSSSPVITGLRVSSSGTDVEAHLYQSSTHRYPTIAGGKYSETLFGWAVSGSIDLNCIAWQGTMAKDQTYPGSGFTYERGTTHFASAGRIDRP